ncbi:NosL protein [Hydrogenothermus marinus]|uniref:NosL protein n=2 Tax=Hydrogenothermus marinus TaxID=133270 RepID=A0A3M0BKC4_9AQUI|nr:NosL protein [Hydrogenothermus marinus]
MMDRKKRILEILREKNEVTAKELANVFKVSEMTIYRDIKQLEKTGEIIRKHGSILLNTKENKESKTVDTCPICEKAITRSHPYKIVIEDKKTLEACCEHCGFLLHKKYEDKEVSAITYDFITENPITAFNAYFVVASSAKPCCSPSVIPFSSKEDAEKFAKGFGGKVLNFFEAYNEIVNSTNRNIKSCCQPQTIKLSDLKKGE